MTKHAGRHRGGIGPPPTTGPGAGTRRSTLLIVIAAVCLVVARLIGPGPGGSGVQLAMVLALATTGIALAGAGVRFGIRAVRAGRDMATAPLVIGSFLAAWGLIVLAGTVGRFVGWR
jgi:hypothetical protein